MEEKMKKLLIFLAMGGVVTFVLFFCGTPIHCAIPHMINYQGMLTDDLGDPLSGPHNLTFRIYDDTTGGNLEWSETQNGVQVENGLLNVILGQVSPLNLPFDEQYWLEVEVDSDTMPRLRFTSVGYAYRALVADSATVAGSVGGGGWVDDGSVLRLQTSTDEVGIGTDSPEDKVEVVDGSMNARLAYHHHFSFPTPHDVYSGVRGTYGGDVEGFLGRRYYTALGGNSYYGVYGSATTTGKNYGVYGSASGGSTNWAGHFDGDVHVSGKVGIGTTSPGVKLQIEGGGDVKILTPNTGYLIMGSSTGPHVAIDNNEIVAKASGTSVGHLRIQGGTEGRTIIYGKVGIGTSSPSEKLDVEGNIDVSNHKIKNYRGFPKPNYDSGYALINQGQTLNFWHNLAGSVENYVVQVWFELNGNRHNMFYGGYGHAGRFFGACWHNLTDARIQVTREADDLDVGQVRVRIWVYE
jgi:hypothetical protein